MCIGCDTPSPEVATELSRRGFLRTAAGAAAAAGAVAGGLGVATPASAHGDAGHGRNRIPLGQISIQLYTLRDLLTADLDGTLTGLHRLGFTKVEHAGFAGRTAAEFRRALDRHQLWSSSGHQGIPQPFDAAAWQRTLSDARTIGQRYLVNPVGPIKGIVNGQIQSVTTGAEWAAFAADLNKAGELVDRPEDHEYAIERDDAGSAALTTAQVGHDFLRSIRF